MIRQITTCWVGTIGLIVSLHAMAAPKLPERVQHWVHRNWNSEDGLPCNSVTSLGQDVRGYLWIGTHEGLARFDGSRFVVFDQRSHKRLKNDFVSGVEVVGEHLWFAVKGQGVGLMRDGQIEVFGESQGFANSTINAIGADKRGTLWIATDGGGVFAFRNTRFERFGQTDGLPSNRLTALTVDDSGRLWVGTSGSGLALRDGNQFRTWTVRDGLPSDSIVSLHTGRSGAVYVGTDRGVARYFGGEFEAVAPEGGLDVSVRSLLEDREGRLWVGTDGAGLALVDGENVSWFTTRDGLGLDRVEALLLDRDGNVWVGTEGGGLEMFHTGAITTYGPWDGLSGELVLSLLQTRDGAVWIGTFAGGLTRIGETGTTQFGTPEDGLGAAKVISMLEDRRGRLLAGTLDSGVYVLDKEPPWRQLDGTLSGSRVSAMTEGPDGELWIGTGNGLLRIGDAGARLFSVGDGLPADNVKALAFDTQGALWIGTRGGLAVMRDEVISRSDHGRRLPTDAILSLYVDGRRLWLGTDSRGIVILDREGTYTLTSAQGLLDDSAFSILEDETGRIWVSCSLGIYSFTKRSVYELLAGDTDRLVTRVYGVPDGMRSRECVGGNQNAAMRTDDNRLWFATVKGVSVVDPPRAVRAARAPDARIEEILIDGISAELVDPLDVPSSARRLDFRYSATGFLAPEQVRFQGFLEGFDAGWQEWGNQMAISYTHLDAGEYTLRIKAASKDGGASGREASLRVRWRPHYFETWWFVSILVFLGAVGVGSIGYGLLRGTRKRNLELRALVDAKTAQLAQRNLQLEELSLRDHLTGLRNRRFLFEVVVPQTHLVATRNQLATLGFDRRQSHASDLYGVVLVDIDDFKQLNEVHGHDARDAVLLSVAQTLSSTVRGDDVVVRWGGEEFLVILTNTQADFLSTYADKVLETIAQRPVIFGAAEPIRLTCSMGLCAFPPSRKFPKAVTLEQCVNLADMALFQAKASGKDRAVVARVDDSLAESEQAFADAVRSYRGRGILGGGGVYFEHVPRRAR